MQVWVVDQIFAITRRHPILHTQLVLQLTRLGQGAGANITQGVVSSYLSYCLSQPLHAHGWSEYLF